MKMKKYGLIVYFFLNFFLISSLKAQTETPQEYRYAIVVSQNTYSDPGWHEVVDSLVAKHNGVVFIYTTSIYDVLDTLSNFRPDYIAFVCQISEASASFVQTVWPFTRALDDDPYGDAIWGIITGCEPQDVLPKIGPRHIEIRTAFGEQVQPLAHYPQGISTSEMEYGVYWVKYPDSLNVVRYEDGPTDRTEWLVSVLNGDSLIFGDLVDIFYTSGHANHNVWQLHYPDPGLEGFFRSDDFGHLYGDPYSGPNIDIISPNPKIYFGIGNCYIGKIVDEGSMAPAWIRNGGAYLYTGYVIPEGPYSYQMGATQAYFAYQNHYPWPVAFFLGNQVFKFDLDNNTPGIGYPPDFNGAALYGDPAIDARVPDTGVVIRPLLYTSELIVKEAGEWDTITFRITMNVDGKPGYDGKWGRRSPIILFPWRVDSAQIIETNAYDAVVTDNFALMYIWYQGQPPLPQGTERHVTFIAKREPVRVKEWPREIVCDPSIPKIKLFPIYPVLAKGKIVVRYYVKGVGVPVSLDIYNIIGQHVMTLYKGKRSTGTYTEIWNGTLNSGRKAPPGLYFITLSSRNKSFTKKFLWIK